MKDFFGVSTVKVEMDCPVQFSIDQETIDGRVTLTGLRDQEISEVKVEFVEEWDVRRDGRTEKTSLVRGTDLLCNQKILLREGEQISCEFAVPVGLKPTMIDDLKMKDGALGVLGKMASLMDFDKLSKKDGILGGVAEVASWVEPEKPNRTYKVIAVVNVVSTHFHRFDPKCEKIVFRVDWGPLKGRS